MNASKIVRETDRPMRNTSVMILSFDPGVWVKMYRNRLPIAVIKMVRPLDGVGIESSQLSFIVSTSPG